MERKREKGKEDRGNEEMKKCEYEEKRERRRERKRQRKRVFIRVFASVVSVYISGCVRYTHEIGDLRHLCGGVSGVNTLPVVERD